MQEAEKKKIEEFAKILRQAAFQNKKVLCIVGSGCSAEAGIKTSKQIIEELDFGFSDSEIHAILKQRGLVVPFDFIPMEAYLSVYQDIFGPAWNDIDSRLREYFPSRKNIDSKIIKKPPLSYALLAHMMKYNFIHSIISLNFDELLEQALDDSLGIGGYKIVSSRSAFGTIKDFELYSDTRVLYKPHGTISAPMTLRATWDRVNRLDDEKIEVLSEVLKNHYIWIFIGYKFHDLDMAPIFLYSAVNKAEVSIWFVNRDSHDRLCTDNRIKQLLKKNKSRSYTNHFIKSESDHFFRKLIKYLFDINADPKMKYYRQGNGYRILDILFEGGLKPSLINRIIYRIFLFSLITKGKFTSKSLLQFNEIKNLLLLYNSEQDISSSLSEVLKEFEQNFGALFLTENQGIYKIFYLKKLDNIFKELAKFLINKLPNNHNLSFKQNKLEKLLENLWHDTDIMLFEEPTDIPFPLTDRKSKVICNLEELLIQTQYLINGAQELAIVAETGEWILQYIDKIKNESIKSIQLIISDPACDLPNSYHYENRLKIINEFGKINNKKDKIKCKFLSFIENSSHMTLSLNKKEGIFFNREAKAPFINPIFISGHDFDRVLTYFQILWDDKASEENCTTMRCRGRQ